MSDWWLDPEDDMPDDPERDLEWRLLSNCGMCTACGSVEVALVKATGISDLFSPGEHHAYPTGYGCEVCA